MSPASEFTSKDKVLMLAVGVLSLVTAESIALICHASLHHRVTSEFTHLMLEFIVFLATIALGLCHYSDGFDLRHPHLKSEVLDAMKALVKRS